MRFGAILFDFDGVIIESEYATNRKLADLLTGYGFPTSAEESMMHYMGLNGQAFLAAIEGRIGGALPNGFVAAQEAAHQSLIDEGVGEVPGAAAFIMALPPMAKAIVSSSRIVWIKAHLAAIGLDGVFGDMIFSGAEHVARGKPDPALYLFAAGALGVAPEHCVVIEDSPVGVTGAVAAGMHVIGLCAGRHCLPGHAEKLRALGADAVAQDWTDVTALIA